MILSRKLILVTATLLLTACGGGASINSDTQAPTTPADLRKVTTESNSVVTRWNASSDDTAVTSYKVFRNGQFLSTSSGTSYTDSNVQPATPYTYTVRAFDAAKNKSNISRELRVKTKNRRSFEHTINKRVSKGTDDAEEYPNGDMYLNSSDLELAYSETSQIVGIRFDKLSIPKNATITRAYLQFRVDENSSGDVPLTIHGQAVNNATTFNNTSFNISSREKTSASVEWNPAAWNLIGEVNNSQRTPELNNVIQEITSRSGWVSGNALAFIISGNSLDKRVADSFEGDRAGAPLLHIEYTEHNSDDDSDGDVQPPTISSGLTEISATHNRVVINWNASSDNTAVLGYKVYRNRQFLETSSDTSYSDNNVLPATNYSYAVRAFDAANNQSDVSSTLQVTTENSGPSEFTINKRVSTGTDDAEEYPNGDMYLNSSDLELSFSETNQVVGIRFGNLPIPKNATITRAYLQFKADETSSGDVPLTIHGQATNSATTFNGTNHNISSRAKTSASVGWEPAAWNTIGAIGNNQRTPELKTIIQEITSRSGWVSGNALAFIISSNSLNKRVAESFEGDSAGAPLLHIEYTDNGSTDDTQAPTVPSGLTEITTTTSLVSIQWNASTDNTAVSGYRVYRDGLHIDTSTTTSFSDTTVQPSTTYAYTVKAFDAASNVSAASSPLSVTTPVTLDTQAPTAPSNLQTVGATQNNVAISWNASTDNIAVSGYRVYRDGVQIGTSTTTSFNDSTVEPNKTYSYTVRAFDAVNNISAASSPLSVTAPIVLDTQAPTVPSGLTEVSVTDDSVTISWNASSDNIAVTGYRVYRNGQFLATSSGTSFTDNSVQPASNYSYTVSAFDAANNQSDVSSALQVTTDNDDQSVITINKRVSLGSDDAEEYPNGDMYLNSSDLELAYSETSQVVGIRFNNLAIPKNVTITKAYLQFKADETSSGNVPLSIHGQDVNNATTFNSTSFNISSRTKTSASVSWIPTEWNTIGEASANQRTPELKTIIQEITSRSGWASGNALAFIISSNSLKKRVAESFEGDSAGAPLLHIEYTDNGSGDDTQAPTAPSNLQTVSVAYNNVAISWAASTDNTAVSGYRVYRDGIQIGSSTMTTNFSDATVQPSTTYVYTVKAFDAAINVSAVSSPLSVTTPIAPDTQAPTAPSNLQAVSVTHNKVKIKWNSSTDNTAVTGYRVYREGVQIGESTTRIFNDTTVQPDKTYSYTVRAFDAANNVSAASAPLSVVTPDDDTVPTFTSQLVKTILSSTWSPSSPDPAGITYLSSEDKLLISDSEVNEMPLYQGVNLFKTTLLGDLVDTSNTLTFSNEPTGTAFKSDPDPNKERLFISDDDVGKIFVLKPGADTLFGTADDVIVSEFDTLDFGSIDPEGVAFGQGALFIADGLNSKVYKVTPGLNGIFDGVAIDDIVSSFDTENLGVEDPEGITFDTNTGHLYIVGEPQTTVAEITADGTLVQKIDISAAYTSSDITRTPAGLAFAPASNNPDVMHLYIVNRGVDNDIEPNENDGKVYEMTLPPISSGN